MTDVPEGESIEQCCPDMECDLVVRIVNVPVEGYIHALRDEFCLFPHACGELMAIIFGSRWLAGCSSDDVCERDVSQPAYLISLAFLKGSTHSLNRCSSAATLEIGARLRSNPCPWTASRTQHQSYARPVRELVSEVSNLRLSTAQVQPGYFHTYWVRSWRTRRPIATKIVTNGSGPVANVAEVYCLATFCEKQERVKLGKELCRRLMNRNKHSLADVC